MDNSDSVEAVCEVCNGRRYSHGAICDRCDGTGKVTQYPAPEPTRKELAEWFKNLMKEEKDNA